MFLSFYFSHLQEKISLFWSLCVQIFIFLIFLSLTFTGENLLNCFDFFMFWSFPIFLYHIYRRKSLCFDLFMFWSFSFPTFLSLTFTGENLFVLISFYFDLYLFLSFYFSHLQEKIFSLFWCLYLLIFIFSHLFISHLQEKISVLISLCSDIYLYLSFYLSHLQEKISLFYLFMLWSLSFPIFLSLTFTGENLFVLISLWFDLYLFLSLFLTHLREKIFLFWTLYVLIFIFSYLYFSHIYGRKYFCFELFILWSLSFPIFLYLTFTGEKFQPIFNFILSAMLHAIY